ncbi:MAG: hypothetical protein U5L01_00815 [Rheinheimera sp.]|nr:hypothetical protein [Rheinheimera sp.]
MAMPLYVQAQESPPAPKVIVNASVKVQQLSHAQLRSIYMMRQVLWPDGSAIRYLYFLIAPNYTCSFVDNNCSFSLTN